MTGQNRCGVDRRYFEHHTQGELQFEKWLIEKKITPTALSVPPTQNEKIYQIPIVVHIIHQGETVGTGLNISEERILEQIDILNQDFRRTNADTSLTPAEFLSVAADTEIEFILAKRDPEGLPTSGIVRKQGSLNGYRYSDIESQSDEYTLKSESQWPTDQYLNIYVTDILNGFIGYAQFPFVHLEGIENPNYNPFLDGVVVDYNYFGVNPSTGGSFESYGRTLTHEMGHYLGLRHIWGDRSPCEQDDFCDDTPEQSSTFNTLCPDTPSSSCGTSDMYSNYLNYTNDACMNIFTQCQKQRMRTVIANSPRIGKLLHSPALLPAIQVANDLGIRSIVSPKNSPCENELFPAVEIRNYGSDMINSGTITLFGNGVFIETIELSSQLASLQTQILNFSPIVILDSSSYTFSFKIDAVNGVEDDNNENDSVATTPIRFVSGTLPYLNSFSNMPSLIKKDLVTEDNSWQITEVPFQNVTNTAVGINFDPTLKIGSEDMFFSPVFDLSSLNSAELNFHYSYSVNQLIPTNDLFSVYVSLDCGQTFLRQQPIFQRSGNALITSAGLPKGPDDWEEVNLNITQFTGYEEVRFAFSGIHGSGGALYIDSLSLESSSLKAYDIGIRGLSNLPVVSCFTSVIPALTIRNYGFETIEKVQIDYQYGNISESVTEDNLGLVPGGESDLFFPISRLTQGEYSIRFSVTQPNDSLDQEPSNNTSTYTFFIDESSSVIPSKNDFESVSNWIINTPLDSCIWEYTSLNDNQVLRANAFESDKLGFEHWFISPILDLSDLDSASMTFDYAYAERINRNDRLSIYASPNCGANFTDLLYSKLSSDLSVSASNEKYIPQNEDAWITEFVDLSPYAESSQLRLAFVFENGNGNDLYLDNIEFYQSSNPSLPRFEELVTVFPNPATSHINLHLNLPSNQAAMVRLVDLSGRIIRSKRVTNALNQAIRIETSGLVGSYLLTWESESTTGSKMIVVNN